MFFKKKARVADYCAETLSLIFSTQGEASLQALRSDCDDEALDRVPHVLYLAHLRAILINLMLIAITKTYGMSKVSSDALVFVMRYLNDAKLAEIESLQTEYNRVFARPSPVRDGVLQMVHSFSSSLTQSALRPATIERLHRECYALLTKHYNTFRSFKLVPG
jgi:hypothetical protein